MSEESRRRTARLVLEALAGTDFVLTGASALLEHGLINRPTVDVDAFTTAVEQGTVPDALDAVTRHLRTYGAEVERHRVFPDFADATVRWGEAEVPLDLGVDWRAHPPAFSGIGPVLDPRDAAGSKLAALYSRREDRDYLDIGSILLTGPWGPEELIALGAEHDPGLDLTQLLRTLDPGGDARVGPVPRLRHVRGDGDGPAWGAGRAPAASRAPPVLACFRKRSPWRP